MTKYKIIISKTSVFLNKKEISYFIFLASLILSTLFAPISNYSPLSFIVKGMNAIILIVATLIVQKNEKLAFSKISTNLSITLVSMNFFALFLAVTLLYSSNTYFGSLKWFNFLITFYPLVYAYYVLFLTMNKTRSYILNLQLGLLLLFTLIIILVIHPFGYNGIYSLSLDQWSHVILGRFIGLLSLMFILFYLNRVFNISHSVAFLISTSLFLLNLITGLRGGILAIGIIAVCLVGYSLLKKNYLRGIIVSLSLLSTLFVFFIFPDTFGLAGDRIINLAGYSEGKSVLDGSISARESLYKISIETIKHKWLWGTGFGGFKDPNLGRDAFIIKYPHNLFLEFWVELGIPGVGIILIFLYYLFKKSKEINFQITLLILYPLLLSMFSKDIPGQTLFVIPIALLALPGENKKLIKEMFSL